MQGLLSQNYLSNAKMFGGSGSNIKSIQHYEVNFAASSAEQDVAITAVDLTKAVIRGTGVLVREDAGFSAMATSLEFKNSTTVTMKRYNATADYNIVSFYVIELNSIKSLQSFSAATSTTSAVATVSAVNWAKSEVIYTYQTSATTVRAGSVEFYRSSNNLNFRANQNVTLTVVGFVVEYE